MQQDSIVNTITAGGQSGPVITKLASGGWVVLWDTEVNSYDVHGQIYGADGLPVGGEFAVNTTTAGGQYSPAVAALSDGGFIVTWTDAGSDNGNIRAQRFTSTGTKVGGEIQVPTSDAGFQYDPDISVAADGSYVIDWTVSTSGQPDASWIARFDAAGNKLGADLNVTSSTGGLSDWIALSAGHYVTAYVVGEEVRARFVDIDSSGTHLGASFLLNDPTLQFGVPVSPLLVALSDGSFASAWYTGGAYGIGSRTFDANGARGTVTAVANDGPFYLDLHLGALDSGYAVGWGYYDGDVSSRKSFARVFDNMGDGIGGRFDVNVTTVGSGAGAEFAGLDDGRFVAVFAGGEIRMRTFDAPVRQNGTAGDDHLVAVSESTPAELNGLDGNDTLDGNISSDELHGGNGADTLNGNDGNDVLSGDAGGDTLSGGNGNDRIFAAQPGIEKLYIRDFDAGLDRGTEIDTLSGGDGNDALFAGLGDNVDGGTGADTLYLYMRNATSGVHLDLSSTAPQLVAGGTIAGVEMLGRLEGSDFADTIIAGTAASLGYTTWDTYGTVYGYGGDDNLTAGFYTPILYGGDGNDTLTGAETENRLIGGAGADTITGSISNDFLSSDGATTDPGYSYSALYPATYPEFDHAGEIDTLSGGAGNDTVMIGYGDNADGGSDDSYFGDVLVMSLMGATAGVIADFSGPTITFGGGTITGFESVDWVEGSDFGDTITFNNIYSSAAKGQQNVVARGGDDVVTAGNYTRLIDGGDGNDVLDGRGSQYIHAIFGGAGNDTLYLSGADVGHGDAGNDTIYGATGGIYGDAGDDLIILAASSSGVFADGGEGNDEIQAASSGGIFIGGKGGDTLTGSSGIDNLYADDSSINPNTGQRVFADDMGTEHDHISAGGNNDRVSIGYGDDADGGTGTDTLLLSLGGMTTGITTDTARFVAASPTILGGGTIQGFERLLSLRGTEFDDVITASTQAMTLTVNGGGGNDVLIATGSVATLNGGEGNDRLVSGTAADSIDGGNGIDTVDYSGFAAGVTVQLAPTTGFFGTGAGDALRSIENVIGSGFADTLKGSNADNVLTGGAGDDSLDGGLGADTLVGGADNDTYYVDNAGDVATEIAGQGTDTVISAINYTLGTALENLTLAGAATTGTGNAAANVITGNGLANILSGGGGIDRLYGGDNDDVFKADYDAGDLVTGEEYHGDAGIDTLQVEADAASIDLTGIVLDSVEKLKVAAHTSSADPHPSVRLTVAQLNGLDGIDIGVGTLAIAGGGTVDLTGAQLKLERIQLSDQDSVLDLSGAFITYGSLPYIYGGGGNDTITGSYSGERVFGMGGNDILAAGGSGGDFLDGGEGNDRLIYDTRYDSLINFTGGTGTDTLDCSIGGDAVTVTLGYEDGAAGIVRATAFGVSSEVHGIEDVIGSGAADMLTGSKAANRLEGGEGNDRLSGLDGDDTLLGGGGDDRIEGGTGVDAMSGGTGNDSYVVDDAGDTVFEAAGEGVIDRVATTVSWTMAAGQEIEQLTVANIASTNAINLTGNELANKIAGNDGANTLNGGGGNDKLAGAGGNDLLDGGTGADQMAGGTGSDSYVVDNAGDAVIEAGSGGADSDTVTAYASWTLGAGQEVERLRAAAGTDPINLAGNELAQKIQGNEGANVLSGGGGNDVIIAGGGDDTLHGGLGFDKLTGGTGADSFVIEAAGGTDMITDFAVASDKIDLTALGFDWQDVQDAMSQNNGNTILNLGGGNSLILSGVANASLHESDFVLAGAGPDGSAGPFGLLDDDMWSGGALRIAHDAGFDWHLV